MQFKDAAYEVLKSAGIPLHYREITARAQQKDLLETKGSTPESSMGALLYTDTLKADSRFRRGETKGTFALRTMGSGSIQNQILSVQSQFKKDLRSLLLKLHPLKFEELIRLLLQEMGFVETELTSFSNDKGVDVRGILRSNALSEVKVAIQAKRWTHNVGASVVRNLRGSLKVADSEQGLIITPSDFTANAKEEAQSSGKTPIRLINGGLLVDLLIQYQVGIEKQEYIVPTLDSDYWTELLGVTLENQKKDTPQKKLPEKTDTYPVEIEANHRGKNYSALLSTAEGSVVFNGVDYQTPTAAAKVITVEWKSVNGWDFWRYKDEKTGKLEKIGKLREGSKNKA